MIAVLQDIRSLHNVGSIFRTADAAGIEKLYLCGVTPAPLDRFGEVEPKLAKVALGAEKYVPWEKVEDIESCLKQLRKEGYDLIAVEQSDRSVPYNSFKTSGKKLERIALVLGAEVKGLPKNVLSLADAVLEIPMKGNKESLNVAVAFGIVVFKLIERT